MGISVDAKKCTGCRSCELVCHFNEAEVFNPKKSRIKVVSLDYVGFNNPVLCLLCKKPECVAACPTHALSRAESGVIQLDQKACSGCRICVDACIVGAINFDEDKGLPLICNLCNGKPACVEWCPAGALTMNSEKNRQPKKRMSYTLTKAKPVLKKWGIPEDALDWYKKFA